MSDRTTQIPCFHCHNSGRATLYLCADGWAGCIRISPKLHGKICKQDKPSDVIAWLEKEAERKIVEWDVVHVEQSGQGMSDRVTNMICRFCGSVAENSFNDWVKPTFTDHDKLLDGNGVCHDCLFWFDERSEKLAALVGKDKPQRMRNYSHFVVGGKWTPLSKGSKQHMQDILLSETFPELAAIAESGQKHIVFRAQRNPPGVTCGWVQFEEQALFVRSQELKSLLDLTEALYVHFSKGEIETGNYKSYRIMQFGVDAWQELESQVKSHRNSLLFKLALFLAQRSEGGQIKRSGDGSTVDNLARDAAGLQKALPPKHLATIRGQSEKRGVHKQSGQVRQLALFELGRDGGES